MILPILSYGHDILHSPCQLVQQDTDGLDVLIADMWETMYNARGCGLAASQVNRALQLFIVDSKTTFDALKPEERIFLFGQHDTGIVETFINASITFRSDETWEEDEGCLSLPNLARPVTRPLSITVEYVNNRFEPQIKTYTGVTARMIQHEFDHTCGKLYIDYLNAITRKLIEAKLRNIASGKVPARYPCNISPDPRHAV